MMIVAMIITAITRTIVIIIVLIIIIIITTIIIIIIVNIEITFAIFRAEGKFPLEKDLLAIEDIGSLSKV